jgi:hypothetical protein
VSIKQQIKAGIDPGFFIAIETPRSRADEESDSVKDFFSVLFAYPEAKPSGYALTGIQQLPLELHQQSATEFKRQPPKTYANDRFLYLRR